MKWGHDKKIADYVRMQFDQTKIFIYVDFNDYSISIAKEGEI